MRLFVFLTFLVAVSTAFPHLPLSGVRKNHHDVVPASLRTSADKWNRDDVKRFFLGFAFGAVDQLGDVSKCMPEVTNLMNHVQALVADFEDAYHTKSIKKTEAALLELAAALHDISSALNDCGLRAAAMDIAKIYKQIQAGLAVKIIISDAIHILKNGREFVHWFKNAVVAFKAKDYYTAGVNVGEITAWLLKESAHPTLADLDAASNKTVQALQFVEGLADGMSVTMGDPSHCLTDVEQMLDSFDVAFHDLQYGFRHKSLGRIESGITEIANGLKAGSATLSACGFTQAAHDVERIVAEIKAGGVLKVVIEEAVKIFSHGRQVEHLFIGAKDAWLSANYQTCGFDVGQLVAFLLAPPKAF